MRRVATAAIVVIATIVGAHNSARAQSTAPNIPLPPATRLGPTPLVWYGIGSIACAAVSPMIGTLVLGRELTVTEVDRMALSCFLGPVGWLLGPVLFPDPIVTPTPPPQNSAAARHAASARPPHRHSAARARRASGARCCWN